MSLGLIGIILSLGLLMYLAYRGINVLILAPILALLATLMAGGPMLATYSRSSCRRSESTPSPTSRSSCSGRSSAR